MAARFLIEWSVIASGEMPYQMKNVFTIDMAKNGDEQKSVEELNFVGTEFSFSKEGVGFACYCSGIRNRNYSTRIW